MLPGTPSVVQHCPPQRKPPPCSALNPSAPTPAEWAAFHAFIHARCAEDDPGEPVLPDADFEHNARRDWPDWETQRILALQDRAVVGSVAISTRRKGTEDHAAFASFLSAWGGVLQARRRQGVATALLHPVLAFMDHRGKTTATFQARAPKGHAFLEQVRCGKTHQTCSSALSLLI